MAMRKIRNYFRRYNLAVRGRDDHRLIERVRAPLAALNDELGAERDQLAAQLAASISERDKLAEQLADQVSRVDRQTTHMNRLVAQDMAKSSVFVERDRLAAQLAELISLGKAEDQLRVVRNLENLRERYLDLTESALTGTILKDPPIQIFGRENFDESVRDRGLDWPKNAFSMIGAARMRNLRTCVERVILGNIPGDIIETGVWRGGASILARAVLAAYGVTDRKVILADSFEGLPPPDKENYPADAESDFHEFPQLAVSLEEVRDNFKKFDLLDDQVFFLKGWFKDTMPHVPAQQIAVLRLDGDMYESTIDPLTHLYDRVSPGGWVIVDDYEWVPACKAAVDDFISARGLKPEIQQIDGVGVFFQKRP